MASVDDSAGVAVAGAEPFGAGQDRKPSLEEIRATKAAAAARERLFMLTLDPSQEDEDGERKKDLEQLQSNLDAHETMVTKSPMGPLGVWVAMAYWFYFILYPDHAKTLIGKAENDEEIMAQILPSQDECYMLYLLIWIVVMANDPAKHPTLANTLGICLYPAEAEAMVALFPEGDARRIITMEALQESERFAETQEPMTNELQSIQAALSSDIDGFSESMRALLAKYNQLSGEWNEQVRANIAAEARSQQLADQLRQFTLASQNMVTGVFQRANALVTTTQRQRQQVKEYYNRLKPLEERLQEKLREVQAAAQAQPQAAQGREVQAQQLRKQLEEARAKTRSSLQALTRSLGGILPPPPAQPHQ